MVLEIAKFPNFEQQGAIGSRGLSKSHSCFDQSM